MQKILLILICSASLLFVNNITLSQNGDLRDKIENIKLDKMTKKLELDETTKETFIEKYKKFSKELRELNKKRAQTYKQITENIESGNNLDSLLNALLEYENEINNKRIDFITDLKNILTSQQIARMIIFERKFNNEIKKLLRKYRKENN